MRKRQAGPLRDKILEWRRKNRNTPEAKAKARAYRLRPERVIADRERTEKYRKANPEKTREATRRWILRNPGHYKEYNSRPEVKARNRMNYYLRKYGEVFRDVFERDKNRCQKCGVDKRLRIHHIDWNKENNVLDNLILLCNSCHRSAHNHIPVHLRLECFEDWMKK